MKKMFVLFFLVLLSLNVFSEGHYWDSKLQQTVLIDAQQGSVYRIAKNSEEYSPYWVYIKSVDYFSSPKKAEISVGFVPVLDNFSSSDFVEFECDEGILADNSMELYDIDTKRVESCSSKELDGSKVFVNLVSVNSNNSVSLQVYFIESEKNKKIPEITKSNGVYSFEPSKEIPKIYKLKSIPVYFTYYGSKKDVSNEELIIPRLEFTFVPDYTVFSSDLFDKIVITNSGFFKETPVEEQGTAFLPNKITFSLNETNNLIGVPVLGSALDSCFSFNQETAKNEINWDCAAMTILNTIKSNSSDSVDSSALQSLGNTGTTTLIKPDTVSFEGLIGSLLFDSVNAGEIKAKLIDSAGKEIPVVWDSSKLKVIGEVKPGPYALRLIQDSEERVAGLLSEWTSDIFTVPSYNPVFKDFSQEVEEMKVDTGKATVIWPDSVCDTLIFSGDILIVKDLSGKEIKTDLTLTKLPTVKCNSVPAPKYSCLPSHESTYVCDYPQIPEGCDSVSVEDSACDSTFLFPLGESFSLSLRDSEFIGPYQTEISAGDTIVAPDSIVKQNPVFNPNEFFEVTFLIGKENYNLLGQEEFTGVIKMIELKGTKNSYYIVEDISKGDRFKVEHLVKGNAYNLIINESDSTGYYNYLYPVEPRLNPRLAIDSQFSGLTIDLRNESFAKTDSFILNSSLPSIQEKVFDWSKVPLAETGFKDLQIASVDVEGKKYFVTKINGAPAYYVNIPKDAKTIEILLEEYKRIRKGFFSIGSVGKVQVPDTKNALNYPSRGLIAVDFSEAKNGLTFAIDSFLENENTGITIDNWDGTPFQFYVCQDKTGDNKCDLWFMEGTSQYGATFVEPNFEAASIEVRLETVSAEKAEVHMILEYDLGENCPVIPEPVEDSLCGDLDEINKAVGAESVSWITKALYNLGFYDLMIWWYAPNSEEEGKIVVEGITEPKTISTDSTKTEIEIGDKKAEMEITHEKDSVEVKPGEQTELNVKVKVTLKTTTSQGYERFGEQSSDCVIAMNNAKKFEAEIEKYSSDYSMNSNLIRAIIQAESSFVSDAIGPDESGNDSSYGLMQIHKTNLGNWTDIFGSDWKTTESWKDPEKSIKAGTRYFNSVSFSDSAENWINNLGCNEKELNTVLPATGITNATWRTALKIARYNTSPENISCNEIKAVSTRETYVSKVLAWFRVFEENYGMDSSNPDYCKPTKIGAGTGTVIEPPVQEITSCNSCKTIQECLACIDYKFVSGIFQAS